MLKKYINQFKGYWLLDIIVIVYLNIDSNKWTVKTFRMQLEKWEHWLDNLMIWRYRIFTCYYVDAGIIVLALQRTLFLRDSHWNVYVWSDMIAGNFSLNKLVVESTGWWCRWNKIDELGDGYFGVHDIILSVLYMLEDFHKKTFLKLKRQSTSWEEI